MIILDTNIFIYHLAAHSTFGPKAKKLMLMIENGEQSAIASVITYSEILTLPAKAEQPNLVKRYQELLLNYPHLKFIPVDTEIAHQAALIRGNSPTLKLMDAMILATAQKHQVKTLITEDKRLKIAGLPFAVKNLNEFFV